MLDIFMKSPVVSAIVGAATIISVILAIYFGIKGKPKKRISLKINKFDLVKNGKNNFSQLKLFYGNDEIENVSISKFTIWNSGNTVLNKSDMVEDKELTITCGENSKILGAQVIAANEDTNKFSTTLLDKSHVLISFDYMDVKEGAVIQVIHTGEDELGIDCKIKGGKTLKDTGPREFSAIKRFIDNKTFAETYFVAFVVVSAIFWLSAISMFISIFSSKMQEIMFSIEGQTFIPSTRYIVILTVVLSLYAIATSYVCFQIAVLRFNIVVPSKLRKYSKFDY